ncbi:beta-ketoacyl synthase N-terminal-like domain-containing protein [Nocardia nova]|uniref:beta-ketoacyl synthase N-terminal-like domain-containing protein n=1 Tax=Nocardia nova TaxID=37330 RepID=UPI00189612FF|nr:beta-ketoacyl synthase N-terminal-like domain-containing protein [Nocardia nova]MBF6148305.1 3-oxoacyl-ACP synthase [Nocardia nova]MDN2498719.1 3-oxoacyl-ACP synthase [Nocardia nova]
MPIAGIGVVSGYGWGRETLWRGLHTGKAAAGLYPGYGADRDEYAWIALVPDGGDEALSPSRYARAVQEAAREAIADATERGWRPGRTVGVIHAIVLGDVRDWEDFYLADDSRRRSRDYLRLLPSTPISLLMQEFGFHGPSMNVSAACSSANVALITAQMWLDQGFADDVICVTTDLSASPDMVHHFVQMGAAVIDADPLEACRPFQEGSRGFSFGEASVAFVVSRQVERPYCAMLGGAMTNDAYHVVSVDPGLERILDCTHQALDRAGVRPGDVSYYNAHGPGTRQCDVAERAVLARIFDDRPQVYSIKPLTGHCMGAAAGVEIAATALGYERGVVVAPPIVAEAHPRLLDGPTPFAGGFTVKTSLGMGGHNSVVVLGPA